MIIDTSFGWQPEERIEAGDTGRNTRIQDQGDDDVTRPVAIPKPMDNASSAARKEMSVDSFNNGYWLWLPR